MDIKRLDKHAVREWLQARRISGLPLPDMSELIRDLRTWSLQPSGGEGHPSQGMGDTVKQS